MFFLQCIKMNGKEVRVKALFTTLGAFVASIDQDQAAQNKQPDL